MRRSSPGLRASLVNAAARLLHGLGLVSLARPLVNRTRLVSGGPGRSRLPRLESRAARNAQILVYHRVNDERDPYFGGVPVARFDRQMAYVSSRFTLLPLDDLVAGLRERSLPPNALAVTFDDGYRDNYLQAGWPPSGTCSSRS